MKVARHGVAVDLSAEGQRMLGFGAKDNMVAVDAAVQAPRLIWTLEVAGDCGTFLQQVNGLGVEVAIPVFRLDDPMSGDIDRLLIGERLLGEGGCRNEDKDSGQVKQAYIAAGHIQFLVMGQLLQPGTFTMSQTI